MNTKTAMRPGRAAQTATGGTEEMIAMVLGGLWPLEASLEHLLDRIERTERAT